MRWRNESAMSDYDCYNPWNLQASLRLQPRPPSPQLRARPSPRRVSLQTRAMTCEAKPAPHHLSPEAVRKQQQLLSVQSSGDALEPAVPWLGRGNLDHVGDTQC